MKTIMILFISAFLHLWPREHPGAAIAFPHLASDNPDNPLARLPRQISVQVRIKSVSLLEDGQALVRYDLLQRNDLGAESQPAPYVAVIRYRFRDRPLAESDRFINPLGFEVVQYRHDPEAPPPANEVAERRPGPLTAATSPAELPTDGVAQ